MYKYDDDGFDRRDLHEIDDPVITEHATDVDQEKLEMAVGEVMDKFNIFEPTLVGVVDVDAFLTEKAHSVGLSLDQFKESLSDNLARYAQITNKILKVQFRHFHGLEGMSLYTSIVRASALGISAEMLEEAFIREGISFDVIIDNQDDNTHRSDIKYNFDKLREKIKNSYPDLLSFVDKIKLKIRINNELVDYVPRLHRNMQ